MLQRIYGRLFVICPPPYVGRIEALLDKFWKEDFLPVTNSFRVGYEKPAAMAGFPVLTDGSLRRGFQTLFLSCSRVILELIFNFGTVFISESLQTVKKNKNFQSSRITQDLG